MMRLQSQSNILVPLLGHLALVSGFYLDELRRSALGWEAIVFALVGSICVVSALIYFLIHPHQIIFQRKRDLKEEFAHKSSLRITVYRLLSWIFLLVWPIAWLIFVSGSPRPIGAYVFLFCIAITAQYSELLFWRGKE